ncbi:MAG: hypothetical protein AVDCRST_MAG69-556, partial [uncultured Solirubrobacteraceae bacterium]
GFTSAARRALCRPGDRLPGHTRPRGDSRASVGSGLAVRRRPVDRQRFPQNRAVAEL